MRWAASLLTMPLLFDAEGIHYPKGKQHLGGWEALQYARMRYEDPEGDYGRQRRQREVLIELTNKLLSFNSLLKISRNSGRNRRTW